MCLLPSIFPGNSCSSFLSVVLKHFAILEIRPGFACSSFLSVVLKHFNHILVATNELAASVQHSGV